MKQFTPPKEAPEGHEYVTRKGKPVSHVTSMEGMAGVYQIVAVVCGVIRVFTPSGRLCRNSENDLDLFDKPDGQN